MPPRSPVAHEPREITNTASSCTQYGCGPAAGKPPRILEEMTTLALLSPSPPPPQPGSVVHPALQIIHECVQDGEACLIKAPFITAPGLEMTQTSINTDGQEPEWPSEPQVHVNDKQQHGSTSHRRHLREARGQRAHTEDPGQGGGGSTVSVDGDEHRNALWDRTRPSLDVGAGPEAIC